MSEGVVYNIHLENGDIEEQDDFCFGQLAYILGERRTFVEEDFYPPEKIEYFVDEFGSTHKHKELREIYLNEVLGAFGMRDEVMINHKNHEHTIEIGAHLSGESLLGLLQICRYTQDGYSENMYFDNYWDLRDRGFNPVNAFILSHIMPEHTADYGEYYAGNDEALLYSPGIHPGTREQLLKWKRKEKNRKPYRDSLTYGKLHKFFGCYDDGELFFNRKPEIAPLTEVIEDCFTDEEIETRLKEACKHLHIRYYAPK